jgi:exodeoxyribonuclease VII large subunit
MNPAFPPKGVKLLSISELTRAVKGVLEEGFAQVWLTGEISNLSRPASGHLYLTLKDAGAQLRAVVWRGVALRLRFDLRDGMEIIACGRLSVYAPRGEYQLVIEQVQPKGIGELELALRQRREKLSQLGYFVPERKKPLPAFPRRVALVTSPSGAAVRDILEILGRRWPALEVLICPVRVQGAGAAEEIAAAVGLLNQLHAERHLPIDVMIVGRGGGSLEDLAAFNEECVAHALFASRIPIVSAVGHEVDVTIADLVADRRALTPSEAAELIVPHWLEQQELVDNLQNRLRDLIEQRLQFARRRLDDLAERRVFRLPLERVRERERQLDDWAERLQRSVQQRLDRARERLEAQAARLETLSPLNVLARGYSLTRVGPEQAVVRSPEQVRPGERIVTQVCHGRIISRVEETEVNARPNVS